MEVFSDAIARRAVAREPEAEGRPHPIAFASGSPADPGAAQLTRSPATPSVRTRSGEGQWRGKLMSEHAASGGGSSPAPASC